MRKLFVVGIAGLCIGFGGALAEVRTLDATDDQLRLVRQSVCQQAYGTDATAFMACLRVAEGLRGSLDATTLALRELDGIECVPPGHGEIAVPCGTFAWQEATVDGRHFEWRLFTADPSRGVRVERDEGGNIIAVVYSRGQEVLE